MLSRIFKCNFEMILTSFILFNLHFNEFIHMENLMALVNITTLINHFLYELVCIQMIYK